MPNLEVLPAQPYDASQRPILLIHGAWHSAICWQETFVPHFIAHGYAPYALSLRGHGHSAGNLRWASANQFVADIEEVVNQIQKQHGHSPFLIGHSMGGYLVQKYLENHSASGAVLLASLPSIGAMPFFLRQLIKNPIPFFLTNLTLSPYHLVSTPERAKALFYSSDFPDEKLQKAFPHLQNESYRAVLDTGLLNLPRPSRVKNTPLLVLGGEQDAIFPPSEVRRTAKAYGQSAKIYPNMAHNMMQEKGWEQVADDIVNWLKEQA